MKHAYVFPGQGSQFPGMGKSLYEKNEIARQMFERANEILGFRISDIMFSGSDNDLKQTNVTQPAVFIHSVILFKTAMHAVPDMVAGHSLGEFSALVANETLSFEDALQLVAIRAKAMQKACEINPSGMAAIIGLPDEKVEEICAGISDDIVVPANYNCPGQIVISGTNSGIEKACNLLKEVGAKRALVLPVGGAFHSPLMEPAKQELSKAIEVAHFKAPVCPIYQNVVACAISEPLQIKINLIQQLTGPVRWTSSVEAMIADGAGNFTEVGPGKVLSGLIQKINKEMTTNNVMDIS
ncbi:MAG: ACP S-malonyltransferase [Ginsengibacter sp.]